MNGVPMKFDYSKTINEQLSTFDYYKDRYCSYELELINDRKEIKRLNNIKNEAIEYINQRFMLDEETGEYYLTHTFDKDGVKKLLRILQGSDK